MNIKKLLLNSILFFLIYNIILAENMIDNKQEKILRIGTNAISYPFEFYENNEIVGFEIELIKSIVKDAGYNNIEVIDKDFGLLIPLLSANKIDVVVSRINAREDRANIGNFIGPYLTDNLSIFIKTDNNTIKKEEDLNGKNVGILFNSISDKLLLKNKNINIIRYNDYEDIMEDIRQDKIDAFVVNSIIGNGIIKKNNIKNIKNIDYSITKTEYVFLVNKKEDEIYKKLNESFNKIKKDGTLEKIKKKWIQ